MQSGETAPLRDLTKLSQSHTCLTRNDYGRKGRKTLKGLSGKTKEAHLSKLKGGNYHEDDPTEAEVEPVSVGQTGIRLPLDQLKHRVDDYHGSSGRSIAMHSFNKETRVHAMHKESKHAKRTGSVSWPPSRLNDTWQSTIHFTLSRRRRCCQPAAQRRPLAVGSRARDAFTVSPGCRCSWTE